MKRRTLEATRISAGSPAQLTLDVLQKRLNDAESQAKTLVKHLEKYGFKHDENTEAASRDEKEGRRIPSKDETEIEKAKQKGRIEKSYEDMATRVCKMESTIQSLKTGIRGMEAERDIASQQHEGEIANLKELHHLEIMKYEEKIALVKKESGRVKKESEDTQAEIAKLIQDMKEIESVRAERSFDKAELETRIERLIMQKNEVTEELQREVSLRQSLEDAHDALLQRVKDMESVVDTERNQVNELVTNWDNTRKVEAATKEAFENEHELRMRLEAVVTQQEHDSVSYKEQLKEISEEKKLLTVDFSKIRKENVALKQKFEITKKAYEELKLAYDAVMHDSKKLHDALKIAATDNKALIAQHKDAVQREKDKVNAKLAAHDQMLDNAKDAILKELERQRAAVRDTEQENIDLKASLKVMERKLGSKEEELTDCDRKYKLEIAQLNCIIDSLRKDLKVTIEEKNEKILKIQKNMDDLSKENSSIKLNMNQLEQEIQRLQMQRTANENEKMQLIARLSSAEHAQLSQQQIEDAMTEMMEAKNKLAYEKGALQSKVDQLSLELSSQSASRAENEQLREKNEALSNQYNKVVSELHMLQGLVKEKTNEVTNLQEVMEKKEKNIKTLLESREAALHEAQKLLLHTESLEKTHTNKIALLQNSLEISQADNKRLAQSFEGVMQSHSKLQSSVEELQTRLGRKDTEIQSLVQERSSTQLIVAELQEEMTSLQNKILALQDHDSNELEQVRITLAKAESQNQVLTKSVESLKAEKKKIKEEFNSQETKLKLEIKTLTDEIEKRKIQWQKYLEDQKKNKGQFESVCRQGNEEKNELKEQLKLLEKKLRTAEQEILARKRKIKKLKEDLQNQNQELAHFKLDNKEQADVVAELVIQIKKLEAELRARDDMQTQSGISMRQFEDEIEEEKYLRLEAESMCMTLQSREQELERKLLNASKANIKVSNDLKEAQLWFQRKVGKLEKELASAKNESQKVENSLKMNIARQTQYILEQTATEQEMLTESEKRKSEEAKKIVRASRMAVSKLANDVTENLWETKGLKHVIQAERNYGVKAAEKYDRLMYSSAQKVEELARELDRAHEKAKKAR